MSGLDWDLEASPAFPFLERKGSSFPPRLGELLIPNQIRSPCSVLENIPNKQLALNALLRL